MKKGGNDITLYHGDIATQKAFLGVTEVYNASQLPYDAQVEYLQSANGVYINSEIALSLVFQIKAKIAFGSGQSSNNNAIGAAVLSNSIYAIPLSTDANGKPYINIGGGNSYTRYPSSVNFFDNTMRTYTMTGDGNTQTLDVDGISSSSAISGTIPTLPMFIFARNNNGTPDRTSVMKLEYMTIEIDGTLVRDFIPVRVGQVGYLYDKVNGQLFGNAGSGAFTYGNDV